MNFLNKENKYYPDVKIFLVLIPFISAFNYYLTYSNIQWNGFLLLTFTIDTVQGYLAWLLVRRIILALDQVLPFDPEPVKRILIQVISTTFAGLLLIIVSTEMISYLVKGEFAKLSFYTIDVLIISIWFLVINGVYIGLHYHFTLTQIQESKSTPIFRGFTIRQGKQEFLIKPEQSSILRIEGEYVQLITVDGKRYLIDESLDYWEKQLPEADFFRLNRQTIVHRDQVSGFTKLENGKLLAKVQFPDASKLELGISRAKAPAFRSWFVHIR